MHEMFHVSVCHHHTFAIAATYVPVLERRDGLDQRVEFGTCGTDKQKIGEEGDLSADLSSPYFFELPV